MKQMRSHKTKLNKWLCSLVMICLLIVMASPISMISYAADYSDPVNVVVPYTQTFDASDNRTSTFTYQIKPVSGAPLPAGSGSAYKFSVKADGSKSQTKGNVEMKIVFPRPGEYQYKVSAYVPEEKEGYTYESRTYTVKVYVKNADNGGLTPLVNVVNENNKKLSGLKLKSSYTAEKVPDNKKRPITTPTGDGNAPAVTPVGATDNTGTEPEDEPEPENPVVDIGKRVIPQADPDRDYWALVNLLCALASIGAAAVMLARYFQRIDTDEDEYIIRREGKLRLLGGIPAIVAAVTFIATEDLTLPMGLVDEWTWLMLVALGASAVCAFVAYKKYDCDNDGDKSGPANNRQTEGNLA